MALCKWDHYRNLRQSVTVSGVLLQKYWFLSKWMSEVWWVLPDQDLVHWECSVTISSQVGEFKQITDFPFLHSETRTMLFSCLSRNLDEWIGLLVKRIEFLWRYIAQYLAIMLPINDSNVIIVMMEGGYSSVENISGFRVGLRDNEKHLLNEKFWGKGANIWCYFCIKKWEFTKNPWFVSNVVESLMCTEALDLRW